MTEYPQTPKSYVNLFEIADGLWRECIICDSLLGLSGIELSMKATYEVRSRILDPRHTLY
jgi:hypothetical protein